MRFCNSGCVIFKFESTFYIWLIEYSIPDHCKNHLCEMPMTSEMGGIFSNIRKIYSTICSHAPHLHPLVLITRPVSLWFFNKLPHRLFVFFRTHGMNYHAFCVIGLWETQILLTLHGFCLCKITQPGNG